MNANEMTFGIEIECYVPFACGLQIGGYKRGIQVPALDNGWKAESDSSLSSNVPVGFMPVEIVSPVLKGAEGAASVRKTCEWLKTIGAVVRNSCGLHVHVGYDGNDLEVVRRLVNLVANHETALYAATGTHRREQNIYCKSLKSSDCQHVKTAVANRNQFRFNDSNFGDRYRSLNLSNLLTGAKRTVEFRAFAGTTNVYKILGYVQLCLGLVQKAASTTRTAKWDGPESTVALRGLNGRGNNELCRLMAGLGWINTSSKTVKYGLIVDADTNKKVRAKLVKMAAKYDGNSTEADEQV